jgi:hypothetical protein
MELHELFEVLWLFSVAFFAGVIFGMYKSTGKDKED